MKRVTLIRMFGFYLGPGLWSATMLQGLPKEIVIGVVVVGHSVACV